MPESIHARRRAGEWRYRVWGSITDSYLTPELTEPELLEHLRDRCSVRDLRSGLFQVETPPRLERARAYGSSAYSAGVTPDDVDGPWEEERCDGPNGCGGFHHAHDAEGDELCDECGEPQGDPAHGPRCDERAAAR
jgi:hypothetical protein